jgi:hypothetical protein
MQDIGAAPTNGGILKSPRGAGTAGRSYPENQSTRLVIEFLHLHKARTIVEEDIVVSD